MGSSLVRIGVRTFPSCRLTQDVWIGHITPEAQVGGPIAVLQGALMFPTSATYTPRCSKQCDCHATTHITAAEYVEFGGSSGLLLGLTAGTYGGLQTAIPLQLTRKRISCRWM